MDGPRLGACGVNTKDKKPRIPRVGLDFGGPATITRMQENPDGSFTFFGLDGEPLPACAGFASLAYARSKGPKVTVQIPDAGEALGSLPTALAPFDHIVGVDTNSWASDSEVVCVSAICKLADLSFEGPRWSCRVEPAWALEFRRPTKDAERIGWCHTLTRGVELGWIRRGARLLLIIDSHLGDLDAINKHAQPIIDDFFLPEGVSVGYASSDAATDSPVNGLIARCDQLAREVLRHVESASSTELGPLIEAERTPFRAHRYWQFELPGAI